MLKYKRFQIDKVTEIKYTNTIKSKCKESNIQTQNSNKIKSKKFVQFYKFILLKFQETDTILEVCKNARKIKESMFIIKSMHIYSNATVLRLSQECVYQ